MDEIDPTTKISNIIINLLMINVLLFGFIGNFLCFKLFLSTKLSKYPISVYFKSISIFDSIVLIEGVNFFIKLNFGFYLSQLNNVMCKIDYYFTYVTSPISPWLMVVVSLDRFLSSAFPNRFLFLHKIRTQLGIIIFIVIINCLLYSFLLWNSSFVSGNRYIFKLK